MEMFYVFGKKIIQLAVTFGSSTLLLVYMILHKCGLILFVPSTYLPSLLKAMNLEENSYGSMGDLHTSFSWWGIITGILDYMNRVDIGYLANLGGFMGFSIIVISVVSGITAATKAKDSFLGPVIAFLLGLYGLWGIPLYTIVFFGVIMAGGVLWLPRLPRYDGKGWTATASFLAILGWVLTTAGIFAWYCLPTLAAHGAFNPIEGVSVPQVTGALFQRIILLWIVPGALLLWLDSTKFSFFSSWKKIVNTVWSSWRKLFSRFSWKKIGDTVRTILLMGWTALFSWSTWEKMGNTVLFILLMGYTLLSSIKVFFILFGEGWWVVFHSIIVIVLTIIWYFLPKNVSNWLSSGNWTWAQRLVLYRCAWVYKDKNVTLKGDFKIHYVFIFSMVLIAATLHYLFVTAAITEMFATHTVIAPFAMAVGAFLFIASRGMTYRKTAKIDAAGERVIERGPGGTDENWMQVFIDLNNGKLLDDVVLYMCVAGLTLLVGTDEKNPKTVVSANDISIVNDELVIQIKNSSGQTTLYCVIADSAGGKPDWVWNLLVIEITKGISLKVANSAPSTNVTVNNTAPGTP